MTNRDKELVPILIHYFLLILLLLKPNIGFSLPRLERTLSQEERTNLYTQIHSQVAVISRLPTYPSNIHPIGERSMIGRGLWLSHEFILTAEAWLEKAPQEESVTFKLSSINTQNDLSSSSDAYTLIPLYRSPQTGLALLYRSTSSSHPSPAHRLELLRKALNHLRKKSDLLPKVLEAPRTLWALTEGSAQVIPVMLTGRGLGTDAYYWKLSAPMRWGDPLFDAQGSWLGIACAFYRFLPTIAVRDFIKELSHRAIQSPLE